MQKTIYWPDDESWDRLAAAAEAKGMSVSQYLRAAAEAQMKRDDRKLKTT